MCVYSMAHDFFDKRFKEEYPEWEIKPFVPIRDNDLINIRIFIEDYKKATEAAKIVDQLTGQPDCEDPEKTKLKERVAELEAKLDKMKELLGDN